MPAVEVVADGLIRIRLHIPQQQPSRTPTENSPVQVVAGLVRVFVPQDIRAVEPVVFGAAEIHVGGDVHAVHDVHIFTIRGERLKVISKQM